jgi:hypothetical protein
MNSTVKSVLLGIAIGIAPIAICALLYWMTPYLIQGNAGALLSFAVMGLYAMSTLTVFVFSIVLMTKSKALLGGAALITLLAQFVILVNFLMGQ